MLSELVKKKIEEKAGLKIRYSRDCEVLADKIHSACNCRLSGSTIRRLFGFIQGTKEVRVHTLDVIANYLDFSSWDELVNSFNRTKKTEDANLQEVISTKIRKGSFFELAYSPNAALVIEYTGRGQFKIIREKNSHLIEGDVIKVDCMVLHQPLFIEELIREGKKHGPLIEAKVSGITTLKKTTM